MFLKQSALERDWDTGTLAKALGTTPAHAKEVASQMAMIGYIDAVPRKRDTWRNTDTGNTVAGVRAPRLTRQKADELLTDLADRASAFNLKNDSPLRIHKILVFDPISGMHDRVQDLDVLIEWDAPPASREEEHRAIQEIKGRSAALKIRTLDDSLANLPARVAWEA